MKTTATITIKNKKYPYILEKTKSGTVHLKVEAACIDQEFLSEDVAEIILDIPNLIVAEQEHQKQQSEIIRFRVSGKDKQKIETQAIKKGYSSVSGYLRDIALQG